MIRNMLMGGTKSEAWDLSKFTPPIVPKFSVLAQDSNPEDVTFSTDGTKMYMLGQTNDIIYQYILSTAWDVSTAVFLQSLSVATIDTSPTSISFSTDGTKMYMLGKTQYIVWEYTLSTAWDISTAVAPPIIPRTYTTPTDVTFSSDGTQMYVSNISTDTIHQFTLSTAWKMNTAVFLQSFSVTDKDTNPQGVTFSSDGTKMYMVGSTTDTVYQYTLSTAWNISTSVFLQSFSVTAKDTNPQGITFSNDGTKMYMVGSVSDSVHQYTLSTAWNISTAVFLQSFSIALQDTNPQGVTFSNDGTKMYMVGDINNLIYQYTLSTAWNISTSVFLQSFSVSDQDNAPKGVTFSNDGTKMYRVGYANDYVHQYTLTTAWDISTANYYLESGFSVLAQDTSPEDITFSTDGTKMYMVGSTRDFVYQYTLSTAWKVDTAIFLQSFSVLAQDSLPLVISFSSDGTKMYIASSLNRKIYQYTLSTAWNISTSVFLQSFSLVGQDSSPICVTFSSDGTKMYMVGNSTSSVYQYTLSIVWDISTTTWSADRFIFIGNKDSLPNGTAFSSDGTKMYMTGNASASVHQYTLSTAWNVSTSIFLQSFSVAIQDATPNGVTFSTDGTKMYMAGNSSDTVYQYTLSTAWDVSTTVFLQSFSVALKDTTPTGVTFSNDGTKMYIIGSINDSVHQYTLSTAWNISTAVFLQSFSVSAQDLSPQDVAFSSDGTKMYMTGQLSDSVHQYTLSTAWDISTSVFLQSFSVALQDSTPTGISFSTDGTKMYMVGSVNDAVYQYILT